MLNKDIVLFDGICHLCNGTVNFLLKRDVARQLVFCPLQSEKAQAILRAHQAQSLSLSTVALVADERLYLKSTAILKLMRYLGFPWNALQIFLIVPKGFRDFFYDIVAKNRYRWFGKELSCRLPNSTELDRFLS